MAYCNDVQYTDLPSIYLLQYRPWIDTVTFPEGQQDMRRFDCGDTAPTKSL